jgi:long-chain acyl-CoA synthetase
MRISSNLHQEPNPAMTTIDALLRDSLANNPLKTALRQKQAGAWRELAYKDLLAITERIAVGLDSAGFAAGDRAAIIGPSSPAWVSAYLGILRSGGIVVPVDKELKSAELRHILSDCEARVLFVDEAYLEPILDMEDDLAHVDRIVLLGNSSSPEASGSRELRILREVQEVLEALPENLPLSPDVMERLRAVGAKVSGHIGGTAALSSAYGEHDDPLSPYRGVRKKLARSGRLLSLEEFQREGELPPPAHTPAEPALILYTSGTTGRSKGAVLSHGNVVSNIRAAAVHFRLDAGIHTLSFLPINHVFEQVCGVLLPLSLGGTVSFAESLKKLGENLVEVRPTFFTGVPAVYRLFHDRILKNIKGKPLSSLLFSLPVARKLVVSRVRKNFAGRTTFVSGGAALDPAIARGLARLGFTLLQGYGITETSPVISAECPGRARPGSVGTVLEGVEVRIERPNEEGVGEILVRGPNVMQGYYKNSQATEEALRDGWYRSGDLGRLDQEGYLYICGRVKNLIVTPNGKNVYPEEVEIELLKSRYITEAMVYGHRIDAVSEEVHAIIFPNQEALDDHERTRNGAPMTEADVEALIRREVLLAGKNLADYKRVKKFTLREDEFPKTTTRKIKRFAVEADVST